MLKYLIYILISLSILMNSGCTSTGGKIYNNISRQEITEGWDYVNTFPLYNNPTNLVGANKQIREALIERLDLIGHYSNLGEPLLFRSQYNYFVGYKEIVKELWESGKFIDKELDLDNPQSSIKYDYAKLTNTLETLGYPTNYFDFTPKTALGGYDPLKIVNIEPTGDDNEVNLSNSILKTNEYTKAGGKLPEGRKRWYTIDYDVNKLIPLINKLTRIDRGASIAQSYIFNSSSEHKYKSWMTYGYKYPIAGDPIQTAVDVAWAENLVSMPYFYNLYPNGYGSSISDKTIHFRNVDVWDYYANGIPYHYFEVRTSAYWINHRLFSIPQDLDAANVLNYQIFFMATNEAPNSIYYDPTGTFEKYKYNTLNGTEVTYLGTKYIKIDIPQPPNHTTTISAPTMYPSTIVNRDRGRNDYACDIVNIGCYVDYDLIYDNDPP